MQVHTHDSRPPLFDFWFAEVYLAQKSDFPHEHNPAVRNKPLTSEKLDELLDLAGILSCKSGFGWFDFWSWKNDLCVS